MAKYTMEEKRRLNRGERVAGKSILEVESTSWCFTVHEPSSEMIERIRCVSDSNLRGVVGFETGKAGETPHLQGCIKMKKGKKGRAIVNWLKKMGDCKAPHVELMINTLWHNWNYCIKEATVLVEWGEMPREPKQANTHADWEFVLEQLERGRTMWDIVKEKPHMARYVSAIERLQSQNAVNQMEAWREMKVHYITGPAGCGKTSVVIKKHGFENVYRITNKKHPFDEYRGEPVIVFEEFRSSFMFDQMLAWIEGHGVMLPCRYNNKPMMATTIYIITNQQFWEQYPNKQNHDDWGAWLRRFTNIIQVDGNEWNKYTVEEWCISHGYAEWIHYLRGDRAAVRNSLEDLL